MFLRNAINRTFLLQQIAPDLEMQGALQLITSAEVDKLNKSERFLWFLARIPRIKDKIVAV